MLPNGVIVWEGASLFDRSPIVLILTGLENPSTNRKTGQMIQSFVLRQDMLPWDAIESGKDVAVCGQCPLKRRICYLDPRSLNNVWRKYKAGGYPPVTQQELNRMKNRHQLLRVTAYGEATAVPYEVWEHLMGYCEFGTGYTHQWETCDPRWKQHLRASLETPKAAIQAQKQGWRTFRIIHPEEPLLPNEILCKHVTHEWIQCEDCKLCNGAQNKTPNIADPIHGLSWKLKNFGILRGIEIIRSKDKSFPDYVIINSWQFRVWQTIVDTIVRQIVAQRGIYRDGWTRETAEEFISRPSGQHYHFNYAAAYLRNRHPVDTAYEVLEKIESEGWIP